MKTVASVASFFVSRIDALVDPLLEKIIAQGGEDADSAKRSHGQVAIASAKAAFQIYNEVFDSDRLRKPAGEGARTQTIDTIPVETLDDYRDHGDPKDRIEQEVAKARGVLDQLPELDKLMEALEKAVQRRGNPV